MKLSATAKLNDRRNDSNAALDPVCSKGETCPRFGIYTFG
jgi:hypothetical protein